MQYHYDPGNALLVLGMERWTQVCLLVWVASCLDLAVKLISGII